MINRRRHRLSLARDVAFVTELSLEICMRIDPIDLAALPIDTCQPGRWMRREHSDPTEAPGVRPGSCLAAHATALASSIAPRPPLPQSTPISGRR